MLATPTLTVASLTWSVEATFFADAFLAADFLAAFLLAAALFRAEEGRVRQVLLKARGGCSTYADFSAAFFAAF